MIRARYRRIVLFFARLLSSIIFWDLLLPRIGLKRAVDGKRPLRLRRYAVAYRRLALEMGGVMIKVGQFLSSRVDVLPPEFTRELEGLQDEVAPERFEDIRRAAESELGGRLESCYAAFEHEPLAAASLGQAHRARLKQALWGDRTLTAEELQGFDVVVKVQRPNIERLIETDLAALRTVGRWLQRYRPIRRRADVPALLEEFTQILYQEIDYINEGHNAETFTANFQGWEGLRMPRVVWELTTRRVLTLENVLAIKITDYEAITEAGVSRKQVAGLLLDTYLKQVFEDGFFHADPHPGNLFVRPLPYPPGQVGGPHPWELTFIDFGMVGSVPPNLLAGLREVLIGVGTQDTARLIHGYQMMDMLLPSADADLIQRASRRVFERFWGKNMAELTSVNFEDVRDLTVEFRDLLYDMPFQVPQNIIFLGRAVGILSGMCTGLDPEFNLWDHLAPYARKLISEESAKRQKPILQELETVGRALLTVPRKVDSILTKLETGQVAVRTPEFTAQGQRVEHGLYQVAGSVTFSALLLGGIQLYLAGESTLSTLLLVASGLNFAWLLLNGRRKRWRR